MKNTKFQAALKKYVPITISLFLVAVILTVILVGCSKELGIQKFNHISLQIKVTSKNKKFNVEDVTLNFKYGHPGQESVGLGSPGEYDFVCYAFYFYEGQYTGKFEGLGDLYKDYRNIDHLYLIKELSADEFLTDEYSFSGNNFIFDRRDFNHNEEITIPKELFEREKGSIIFHIVELYFSNADKKYGAQYSQKIEIDYEFIDENTIKLS